MKSKNEDFDIEKRLNDFCLIGKKESLCVVEYVTRDLYLIEDNKELERIIGLLLENKNPVFTSIDDFNLNGKGVIERWRNGF